MTFEHSVSDKILNNGGEEKEPYKNLELARFHFENSSFLTGVRGIAAITFLLSSMSYVTYPQIGFFAAELFFCLSAFLLTIKFYNTSSGYLEEDRGIKDWLLMLVSYFTRRFGRVFPIFFLMVCSTAIMFPAQIESAWPDTSFNMIEVLTFSPNTRFGILWCLPMIVSYYFVVPVFATLMSVCGKKWGIANFAILLWVLQDSIRTTRSVDGTPISDFKLHLSTFLAASTFAIFFVRTKSHMNIEKTSLLHKPTIILLAKIVSTVLLALLTCVIMDVARMLDLPITFGDYRETFTLFLALDVILLEMLFPSSISSIVSMKILTYFGKISYPLVLVHLVVLKLAPCSASYCKSGISAAIYVVIISVFLSSLMHFFLEKPTSTLVAKFNSVLVDNEEGPTLGYIPLSHNETYNNGAKFGIKRLTKVLITLLGVSCCYVAVYYAYSTSNPTRCIREKEWALGKCAWTEGAYWSRDVKKVLLFSSDLSEKCAADLRYNVCKDCEFTVVTEQQCNPATKTITTKAVVTTPNQGPGSNACPADTSTPCIPVIGCELSAWSPGICQVNNGKFESVDTRTIIKSNPSVDTNTAYDANGESCGELTRTIECTNCEDEPKLDEKCDGDNKIWVRYNVLKKNVGLGSKECKEPVEYACPSNDFEHKQLLNTVFFQQQHMSEALATAENKYSKIDTVLLPLSSNTTAQSKGRLVFSISTFPSRCENLWQTLLSLYSQTRVPDVIYIHMPQNIKRITQDDPSVSLKNIENLKQFIDSGPLKSIVSWDINATDYGPATKLIGSLFKEDDDETLIITGDDDVVYGRRTVEILEKAYYMRKSQGFENTITATCGQITSDIDDKIVGVGITEGVCAGIATAFSGTLYRRGWLRHEGQQVWDYTGYPEGCWLHDDVYLSGILWKWAKIHPFVVDFGILFHHEYNKYSIHNADGMVSKNHDCVRYFDYYGSSPSTTSA